MEKPNNSLPKSPSQKGRVVVVGAGGFAAKDLYLKNLPDMGISGKQVSLVDTNEARLHDAADRTPGARTYSDTDQALSDTGAGIEGNTSIIIASSTGAHADNLKSVLKAVRAGHLDPATTKIWSEKPITSPEVFDEVRSLFAEYPELDVSVGYILRFSETLQALQSYIEDNKLTVVGLNWVYGKDRRGDKRPTQGVLADETVHPLSVTDLVLTRALGEVVGAAVNSASVQTRSFVDTNAQKEARSINPSIPRRPISDVDAALDYVVKQKDGSAAIIPVTMSVSFLFDKQYRELEVSTTGPNGPETLSINFDASVETVEGDTRRADILTKEDGTLIYEWDGDKSVAQVTEFLADANRASRPDALVNLEKERHFQALLTAIGRTGLDADALSRLNKKNLATNDEVTSDITTS